MRPSKAAAQFIVFWVAMGWLGSMPPRASAAANAPKAHSVPAKSFAVALPGYRFKFPYDHGSHPDYATEWWYYTGHLRSREGRSFGYQLTWFRVALAPQVHRASAFAARDIYFAHFAITDELGQTMYFTDRIERSGPGLAGATPAAVMAEPKVWIGPWALAFSGPEGRDQHLRASGLNDAGGPDGGADVAMGLDLTQHAVRPAVDEGLQGVSQKSAGVGRSSHYYSYTRLATSGTLKLGQKVWQVTGTSWFDHEFGSSQLAPNQVGWDWFSVQLQDGRDLMLYRLRLRNGGTEPYSSGTLVEPNGTSHHLTRAQFSLQPQGSWHSAQSGATYPVQWRVRVPSAQLDLLVTPTVANQELRPLRSGGGSLAYWEGSVRVSGIRGNGAQMGQGYLEMTGYGHSMNGLF